MPPSRLDQFEIVFKSTKYIKTLLRKEKVALLRDLCQRLGITPSSTGANNQAIHTDYRSALIRYVSIHEFMRYYPDAYRTSMTDWMRKYLQ